MHIQLHFIPASVADESDGRAVTPARRSPRCRPAPPCKEPGPSSGKSVKLPIHAFPPPEVDRTRSCRNALIAIAPQRALRLFHRCCQDPNGECLDRFPSMPPTRARIQPSHAWLEHAGWLSLPVPAFSQRSLGASAGSSPLALLSAAHRSRESPQPNFVPPFPHAKRPPGNRAAFFYGRQFQQRQSHRNSLVTDYVRPPVLSRTFSVNYNSIILNNLQDFLRFTPIFTGFLPQAVHSLPRPRTNALNPAA